MIDGISFELRLIIFVQTNLITQKTGVLWRNFKLLTAVIHKKHDQCDSDFARP